MSTRPRPDAVVLHDSHYCKVTMHVDYENYESAIVIQDKKTDNAVHVISYQDIVNPTITYWAMDLVYQLEVYGHDPIRWSIDFLTDNLVVNATAVTD